SARSSPTPRRTSSTSRSGRTPASSATPSATRWSPSNRLRRLRMLPGRRHSPISRTSPAELAMTMLTDARPAPPRRRARPGRERVSRWHRLDLKVSPYLYIAPFFVVFGIFGLFPLLYTGWLSLSGWREDQDGSQGSFVGLANYAKLLHDQFFWNALKNTIGIGIISTVPQLMLALGLAHLLNYRLRGRTFFRMSVLVPNVTSVAAITIIFVQ